MDQTLKNISDETVEIVKDFGRVAKKQVVGQGKQVKQVDHVDQITGKPIPSKKVLTQLNQQVAQLSQMRMKKVREELEKQRLKVAEPASAKASAGEAGKPKEDVIAKVLRASKSTGEFGKNIGG